MGRYCAKNLRKLRCFAHLVFDHVPQGEEHVLQLRARDLVEKISLIFILVRRAQQIIAVRALFNAAVMSGSDIVRAQLARIARKGVELDLTVAKHVRIGRSALFVFTQKMFEDPLVIFAGKVHAVIGNVQHAAHPPHIVKIFIRGAGAVFFLFHPVAHEQPDHFISALFEKICRHGAVYAAAQTHYDFFLHTAIIPQCAAAVNKNA